MSTYKICVYSSFIVSQFEVYWIYIYMLIYVKVNLGLYSFFHQYDFLYANKQKTHAS